MSRKPPVGDQTWMPRFRDENVIIYKSTNEYDYYKVAIKGKRVKYFYGELAWCDVPRFVQDELGDMKYWGVLE
jgi:hypothetical protein